MPDRRSPSGESAIDKSLSQSKRVRLCQLDAASILRVRAQFRVAQHSSLALSRYDLPSAKGRLGCSEVRGRA